MLFFFLLLVVCAFLAVERIRHERQLNRLPIRIHVNGTRGKSNVTRLIAAALRQSGIRTLGKTTGMTPRLILPDGSEKLIRRWAPANILEQVLTVRIADKLKVNAIVIECMALDPMLQYISEKDMIRSTVGVITNVRPDHFELMGDNLDDIAEALSQTIPENGMLITGDCRYYPFFASSAFRKGSKAILADGAESETPPSQQERFLFRENIAIARAVVSALGHDPAVVTSCLGDLDIMRESAGVFQIRIGDRNVHFVDAFSANDVDSTRIIQERAFSNHPCSRPRIAVFNNRADRPLRMQSFALGLLGDPCYDYVAVTGECCRLAQRFIRRKTPRDRILILEGRTPGGMLDELFGRIADREFTIVGMGNEKGPGRLWTDYLGKAALQ